MASTGTNGFAKCLQVTLNISLTTASTNGLPHHVALKALKGLALAEFGNSYYIMTLIGL